MPCRYDAITSKLDNQHMAGVFVYRFIRFDSIRFRIETQLFCFSFRSIRLLIYIFIHICNGLEMNVCRWMENIPLIENQHIKNQHGRMVSTRIDWWNFCFGKNQFHKYHGWQLRIS